MPLFTPLVCLLCMGLAALRHPAAADPATRDDAPLLLLRWAAGLLPAQREEWGQAMLGELDHIAGRARRWRFATGCAGAVLLVPPRGRAAAALWAITAMAAAGAGLYAWTGVRYGLGTSDWVLAAIALVVAVGYILVVGVQVRRPGVVLPGLVGGLLVAVAWLVPNGFTFYGLIVTVPHLWAPLLQVIVVPLVTGVAGTLWSGSAVTGRRIARLAALSAGVGVFLYGTLAIAVIGAAGAQIDATWTISANVADRLATNAVFYLWFLPVTTAALGWAAAAATARVRPRLATVAASTTPSSAGSIAAPSGRALNGRWSSRLLLACTVVGALVILAGVFLKG